MNNPFGLDDDDYHFIQTIVQTIPYSVYVFGSRARGTQTRFSDLDLYIDGNLSGDMVSNLTTMFDESNISIKVEFKNSVNVSEDFLALIKPDFVLLNP